MIFITGGKAQGKRAYAEENYIGPDTVIVDGAAAEAEELMRADVIDHLEEYIRRYHEEGNCELPEFREHAVILCDEVGCGIIPLDREERMYREAVGRTACRLAKEADAVIWLRCGIAQRIK